MAWPAASRERLATIALQPHYDGVLLVGRHQVPTVRWGLVEQPRFSGDGLVISIWTMTERFTWSSLTNFRIGPIVRKVDTISADFAPGFKPLGRQRLTTRLTRALEDADLNVSNLTKMETSELVERLNERQRRVIDG